jgi:hypothetical protein
VDWIYLAQDIGSSCGLFSALDNETPHFRKGWEFVGHLSDFRKGYISLKVWNVEKSEGSSGFGLFMWDFQ